MCELEVEGRQRIERLVGWNNKNLVFSVESIVMCKNKTVDS